MIRFLDILFSGLAIVALSPLLAPVMVVLKFTGEGEIFFLQERIGRHGKKFQLFKFATMLKDSPNIGTGSITMKNDPRVLPVGGLLRKTKINELPQLLNILIGDMSVIGPRPLTSQTFEAYPPATQSIIQQVRPGLSGIGSIVFRGEEEIMHGTSASVDFYVGVIAPYKGALEEWYVRNLGIRLYFLAILMTILVVMVPTTRMVWNVFKDLPHPPEDLRRALNFSL